MVLGYSKLKVAAALVLMVAGVTGAAYGTGYIVKPDVGLQDRGDWIVQRDNVSVETSYWLYVSDEVKLNISRIDVDYRLKMNSVALAEGSKDNLVLAKGNSTGEIETDLLTDNIPRWWATHLQKQENSRLAVPVKVVLKLGPVSPTFGAQAYTDEINTDLETVLDNAVQSIEGSYRAPELVPGPLSSPTRPEINVTDAGAEWGTVTVEKTNVKIFATVSNPNSYPIPVPGLEGFLEMNGVDVASWEAEDTRALSGKRTLLPGESKELVFRVQIDNQKVKEWFITHVRNNEQTDAVLNTNMVFSFQDTDVDLPGGDGLTCSFSFQTGILEDDQKSDSEFEGCDKPGIYSKNQQEDSETSDSDSDDSDDSDQSVPGGSGIIGGL